MEADWNLPSVSPELLEYEESATVRATLVVEFEARLTVRETLVLTWVLPVQRLNIVAFGCEFSKTKVLDVITDALDSLLQDDGVYPCEVKPPVCERRKRVSDHPDTVAECSFLCWDLVWVNSVSAWL